MCPPFCSYKYQCKVASSMWEQAGPDKIPILPPTPAPRKKAVAVSIQS